MEPSLPELLLPGLKLMLTGMGIVFLFLALLVLIIGITARLLHSVNPQPEPARRSGLTVEPDEAELVAVIAAVLHRHKV
jgi:oxaloacetate decarboxylase gamma subunit